MKTKFKTGLSLLSMTLIVVSFLFFSSSSPLLILMCSTGLILGFITLYMPDPKTNKADKIKVDEKKAELTAEKVAEIKKGIQVVELRLRETAAKRQQECIEESNKINSVCPKCGCKRVGDRIKRQQGEIEGSFSGIGSLFGGSSMYGSIHGKMDTNEVNKCNDCEHEWKKHKPVSVYATECFDFKIGSIRYAMQNFKEAKNCTYDALDTTETYFSHKEKVSDLLKKTFNSWRFKDCEELWKGVKIDVINELAKKYLESYDYERWVKYYDEDALLAFGLIK